MQTWALLCLLLALSSDKADAKRFDPFMVDPLMRRSPLDKNFMRFGRSLPIFPAEQVAKLDSIPEVWSKDDVSISPVTLPPPPVTQNFSPRTGRGEQDNFMRFGRSKNDNFMRFGRNKQDNFIRFGRGKQSNFVRFGRGKSDNFMRLGRGKSDNFMRFGRGKQDNFMRFGRGKENNFMRFGRDFEDQNLHLFSGSKALENGLFRDSRGKADNFMRFGRYFFDDTDFEPIALHGILNVPVRDSRAKQANFMRFGKSLDEDLLPESDYSIDAAIIHQNDNSNSYTSRDLFKNAPSKRGSLVRAARQPPNKADSFIRFGRSSNDETKSNSETDELIPQRLKRSTLEFDTDEENENPSKIHETNDHPFLASFSSHPYNLEEEISPSQQVEDYNNRRKRSLNPQFPSSTPNVKKMFSTGIVPAKPVPIQPELQTSLISAGLPNVIVGPEFSLLPDLNPPSTMRSGNRPDSHDFLRLG